MLSYNDYEELMETEPSPRPTWYYMADCGRWHEFEDDPDNPFMSDFIEDCYQRNPNGTVTSSFHFIEFDFSAMLQTDLGAQRVRRIKRDIELKRSCSCFSIQPDFWESDNSIPPYQIVPVSQSTSEYRIVANYVMIDGLLAEHIVSIYRIQNLDLWEFYCRKKTQLMRIRGVKEIPEIRLFHGTEIENVHAICTYNFDSRLPHKNGHLYGHGIYFAKYAALADIYSQSSTAPFPLSDEKVLHSQDGATKILILARVIVGTPIAGQPDFLKPDDGKAENVHDSCVDDIKNPKIFVIFDHDQIYPEYVIQYISSQ